MLKLGRNGHTVVITSRRKVVATPSPPAADIRPARKPWADLEEHFAQLLSRPKLKVTGVELLAGERDRF